MANSIVYEHNTIKKYYKIGEKYVKSQLNNYKFVKSNNRVYSVSTSYSSNKTTKKINYLIVKNLDTQKTIIQQDISSYYTVRTQDLDVFMYSDLLLCIGIKGTTYGYWIFNLFDSSCYIKYQTPN